MLRTAVRRRVVWRPCVYDEREVRIVPQSRTTLQSSVSPTSPTAAGLVVATALWVRLHQCDDPTGYFEICQIGTVVQKPEVDPSRVVCHNVRHQSVHLYLAATDVSRERLETASHVTCEAGFAIVALTVFPMSAVRRGSDVASVEIFAATTSSLSVPPACLAPSVMFLG